MSVYRDLLPVAADYASWRCLGGSHFQVSGPTGAMTVVLIGFIWAIFIGAATNFILKKLGKAFVST